MMSPQETLAKIDQELAQERRTVDELAKRLDAGSARSLAVSHSQLEAYRELARLRVQALATGASGASGLPMGLDDADRRAAAVLEQRRRAADELGASLQDAEAGRTELETERAGATERVAAASAALDAAEARTQARLEAAPDYQRALGRTHEADRIAKHAEEKANVSEQELGAKGRAYREDPLFMYLWRRRYGTSGYRAAPLFRWLDGRVARHASFEGARADYARLLDLPKRLREHADERRRLADAAFAEVNALDGAARNGDGIPALEALQADALAAQQAIDRRLEEHGTHTKELLDRRQTMAAGEDDAYLQAVEILATALEGEALQELQREARATPLPDDDVIIARLDELTGEAQELDAAAAELKAAVQGHKDRLGELENLRAEFKHRHYDEPGGDFEDGTLVATVLANVIGGMLTRQALWRVLDQQRRLRPPRTDVKFGSGGFGRGSPWGGGFRTGGRGGPGGGFRTGGKF